ncbi:NAD-dependent deacylase|uniref:protein acetyllysine N-acetyltransferase n=1 Tax=Dendrosporobacter quercicolus TaxID=146817 RepID=A0A1G9QT05_9FIRM|nr:NAD-dependent deacylase [Dendrosporobacter quercicolus]NSL48353.1 NAD-dependent deacylase [Dendrosporobacter quercicolus DSM 1736]SDM14158.1 NAD-dependent deacetylase [Dendrosporobacter quercicolus]
MRQLIAVADCWRQARRVIAFTGAGMSTESGLPDFRSARGLWKQRPESLATMEALVGQPDEFYFFYQWRIAKLWSIQPHAGHQALAELQKAGYLSQVVTQNVDGLHQRAGCREVLELHGTLRTVSCLNCQAVYDSRTLVPEGSEWERAYQEGTYRHGQECRCPKCQGLLRPDVVLFGEPLPSQAWQSAIAACSQADLLIVIGSSLLVAPASYCPQAALDNRAKLLIINQDSTSYDQQADWIVREAAGQVLVKLRNLILAMQ